MKLFFETLAHQDAIEFLKTRPAVTREIFDQLSPEMKAISFVVTGIDSAKQLQLVKNMLAKLPAGTTYDEVIDLIAKALPLTGMAAERRAELILRHWGGVAFASMQWQMLNRQRDVFPYWQYISMGDDRVRATHRALHQIVLPHDDPFWDEHFPPWEPMCRCQIIGLSQRSYDKIEQEDKDLPPDRRRIISGPLRAQIHENNRLVRGLSEVYDLRTPAQKGKSWIGWNPRDMAAGLDIAKTQAELDSEIFGKLQKHLKAQDLGKGQSVWDWWVAKQTARTKTKPASPKSQNAGPTTQRKKPAAKMAPKKPKKAVNAQRKKPAAKMAPKRPKPKRR